MAIDKLVFCDTNFLLDVFDPERAGHDDAIALLWYRSDNAATVELAASITSFKDAYYILTRLYKDEALARASIESIMGRFVRPVDMLGHYGKEALDSGEPDFEDGLIRACAEHEGASVIITRNARAFTTCAVPALPAENYLSQVGFDYDAIEW